MVITPGALVFDIGGHHGESCDKFLNHYQAGIVVTVEPDFDNFTKLRTHWAGDPRVIPIHAAVHRVPGILNIHRAPEQDGLTTTVPEAWSKLYEHHQFDNGVPVPAITMDMLVAMFGRPEYVKVDVEGAEYDVLLGMTTPVQTVAFEFHGKRMGEVTMCLGRLTSLGFTRAYYVTEDIDLVTVPTRPIAEVSAELWRVMPEWGNITVQ